MSEQIEVSTDLPATAQEVFTAWLSSQAHSQFTGAAAVIDPALGGSFTAWDAYIWGTTLEIEQYTRILQAWRTVDFPEAGPDSLLEIRFTDQPGGMRLDLLHTQIPDGQGQEYAQGWQDSYFTPMLAYFTRQIDI